MSILIKGMDMPHNCGKCWIPCTVEFQDRNYLSRPKCCPCCEVKIPHGRLIDADMAKVEVRRAEALARAFGYHNAVYAINDAPTIIEAEESE